MTTQTIPVHGVEEIESPLQTTGLNKKGLADYVINPASGCIHGCTFCYVPSTPAIRTRVEHFKTHGVEDPQDWGNYLLVRWKVAQQLPNILNGKRTWRETPSGKGVVLLSSTTDPFQTPRVTHISIESIKILVAYQRRVRVLTRSPAWTQHLDALMTPYVTVGMSIPHLDDDLSFQVEPQAPPPSYRLKAMHDGKRAGLRQYVAIAPTPPTMTQEDFLAVVGKVSELDPEVIFWEPINARGTNGKRMKQAGIEFAEQIMHKADWADMFLRQMEMIQQAAESVGVIDRLHLWPDQALKDSVTDDFLGSWLYRPTPEEWPNSTDIGDLWIS